MSPALEPGDRLLVMPFARIRPGQMVAVHDPRVAGRVLVKRIRSIGREGVDVRGDNPGASTDSRHFGSIPPGSVVGTVVYRYHPPDRTGWIHE